MKVTHNRISYKLEPDTDPFGWHVVIETDYNYGKDAQPTPAGFVVLKSNVALWL